MLYNRTASRGETSVGAIKTQTAKRVINVANIDAGNNRGQMQNNGRKQHRTLRNNMISAHLLDALYIDLGLRDGSHSDYHEFGRECSAFPCAFETV